VRVESAVAEGDGIPLAYDPMIAKLIAAGADREEAFDRLAAALAETEVAGPVTNLPFLRWLIAHPVVRAGDTTTAFLSDYPPLSAPPRRSPADVWRGGFRLNLPAAPLASPPDVDSHAADHRPGGDAPSSVSAPMPGTVIRVHVHEGSTVSAGEPLVVLEAMKMETPLTSPYDGVVRSVRVKEGDRVAGGAVLVDLDS
jgi:acetyl/propionyl-CoA carboxylase alpha subunit